jgi:hypothetical protein
MAEFSVLLLQIYSLRHFILHRNIARIERHSYIHFTEYCTWVIAEYFLPIGDCNQNGVTYTLVEDA